MKKIILGITLLALCSALASCDDNEFEKCTKSVKKSLSKDAPKSLDEAIASFDWAVAHKYIGCYETARYYDEIKRKEAAKERLFRAEAAFFLSQGELGKAESVAKEMDKMDLYREMLVDELQNMIKQKKYDEVVSILSSWKFTEDYNTEVIDAYYDSDHYNRSYNSEISTFNDIVDNLLIKAIFESDTELAKKCLLLYVPNAVCSSKIYTRSDEYKNKYHTFKYSLKNTYKEAAQKKLKEAGMQL